MAVDVGKAGPSMRRARRRLSAGLWRRPWVKASALLGPPLAWLVLIYLAALIALLGIGTVVFPSLHAAEVATSTAVFFSIVLPVAGLSLGAILTIRQHHALASRFHRMRNDLLSVRDMLLDADTATKLRRSAFEAARIVADEAGDWLGAMWFLDADHPA